MSHFHRLGLVCLIIALFPEAIALGQTSGPTPAEQLAAAAALRLELRWDEALTLLRVVVDRRTEDEASAALAQARIGQYLVAMGRPADAVPELLPVPADFPNQPQAIRWSRVYLTDAYLYQNQLDPAETIAEALSIDCAQELELLAWARLKLAEIGLARGDRPGSLTKLRAVVDISKDTFSEPANWARVRLAETLTHSKLLTEATRACDEVIGDHAVGRAHDEQAAWTLLWKGRVLKVQERYEDAAQALQMGSALADGKFPLPSYLANLELGEVYRLQGDELPIESGGGALHEQALSYYRMALEKAQQHQLSESEQDHARLQVGSEMRHLGMRTRGIAWLRWGIEDPAKLSPTDRMLSERLSSFMESDEAEAWQKYLIDPVQAPDPTTAFVLAEFASLSPPPSVAAIDIPFRRRFWLGRLYQQQGRNDEASQVLEQALALATRDDERAEALTWLASSYRRMRFKSEDQAKELTGRAVDIWLQQLSAAARDGDAHYAIDMVALSYEKNGWVKEMFAALEQIVATLSPQAQPSRACFARFRLAQEYIEYRQYDKAVPLIEESLSLFLDQPFPDHHEELTAGLCFMLGFAHIQRDDMAAAAAAVARVEALWPERFAGEIAGFKAYAEQR